MLSSASSFSALNSRTGARILTSFRPKYFTNASSVNSDRSSSNVTECTKSLQSPYFIDRKIAHLNSHAISRTYCDQAGAKVEQKSFKEKFKDFWNGPNFKYWFIGVSAFSAWLFYYSLKSYKSTRIDIDLPIAVPGHPLTKRNDEVNNIINKLREGGMWNDKPRIFALTGPTGCGKSLLASFVADELIHEIDWNPLGLPKSHIKVFLNGDTLKSFHLSLQAFASKLSIRPSEIKSKLAEITDSESLHVQCHVLFDLIKEKLEKHPDWVMVVDNLQQGISKEVVDVIKGSLTDDGVVGWSRGIVLLTFDGIALDDAGITQIKLDTR